MFYFFCIMFFFAYTALCFISSALCFFRLYCIMFYFFCIMFFAYTALCFFHLKTLATKHHFLQSSETKYLKHIVLHFICTLLAAINNYLQSTSDERKHCFAFCFFTFEVLTTDTPLPQTHSNKFQT